MLHLPERACWDCWDCQSACDRGSLCRPAGWWRALWLMRPPKCCACRLRAALFVALNEFPALESDFDSAAAAEALMSIAHGAGCPNHAAALGLLLCDEAAIGELEAQHPQVHRAALFAACWVRRELARRSRHSRRAPEGPRRQGLARRACWGGPR